MNPNDPSKPSDKTDGEKPPEVPATESTPKVSDLSPVATNFTVEARARYDDESPPPPPKVLPVTRKPTVVASAAPALADRPPILVSDRPIARPVADDDYDFDPLDVDPPAGMHPLLKVFLVLVTLAVLLPFAGIVLLFIACATSGTF